MCAVSEGIVLSPLEQMRKQDIDSLRGANEPALSWERRRLFLEVHWDNYSMEEIAALSSAYINVLTLGCEYSLSMMHKLNSMAVPVAMAAENERGGNPLDVKENWLHEKLQKKVYQLNKLNTHQRKSMTRTGGDVTTKFYDDVEESSAEEDFMSKLKDNKNLHNMQVTNINQSRTSQSEELISLGLAPFCCTEQDGEFNLPVSSSTSSMSDVQKYKTRPAGLDVSNHDIIEENLVKARKDKCLFHVMDTSNGDADLLLSNVQNEIASKLNNSTSFIPSVKERSGRDFVFCEKMCTSSKNYPHLTNVMEEEGQSSRKKELHSGKREEMFSEEGKSNLNKTSCFQEVISSRRGDNSVGKELFQINNDISSTVGGIDTGERSRLDRHHVKEKTRSEIAFTMYKPERKTPDRFRAYYVGGISGYRSSTNYTHLVRKVRTKKSEQEPKAIKDLRLAKQKLEMMTGKDVRQSQQRFNEINDTVQNFCEGTKIQDLRLAKVQLERIQENKMASEMMKVQDCMDSDVSGSRTMKDNQQDFMAPSKGTDKLQNARPYDYITDSSKDPKRLRERNIIKNLRTNNSVSDDGDGDDEEDDDDELPEDMFINLVSVGDKTHINSAQKDDTSVSECYGIKSQVFYSKSDDNHSPKSPLKKIQAAKRKVSQVMGNRSNEGAGQTQGKGGNIKQRECEAMHMSSNRQDSVGKMHTLFTDDQSEIQKSDYRLPVACGGSSQSKPENNDNIKQRESIGELRVQHHNRGTTRSRTSVSDRTDYSSSVMQSDKLESEAANQTGNKTGSKFAKKRERKEGVSSGSLFQGRCKMNAKKFDEGESLYTNNYPDIRNSMFIPTQVYRAQRNERKKFAPLRSS